MTAAHAISKQRAAMTNASANSEQQIIKNAQNQLNWYRQIAHAHVTFTCKHRFTTPARMSACTCHIHMLKSVHNTSRMSRANDGGIWRTKLNKQDQHRQENIECEAPIQKTYADDNPTCKIKSKDTNNKCNWQIHIPMRWTTPNNIHRRQKQITNSAER